MTGIHAGTAHQELVLLVRQPSARGDPPDARRNRWRLEVPSDEHGLCTGRRWDPAARVRTSRTGVSAGRGWASSPNSVARRRFLEGEVEDEQCLNRRALGQVCGKELPHDGR